MRRSKIKYDPSLSVKENAERNHVSEDGIRYYIKTHGIDRRTANREKIIKAIKACLKENPEAKVSNVAKATNIATMTIRKYWEVAKSGDKNIRIGKRKLPKTDLKKLKLTASVFQDLFHAEHFGNEVLEPFIGDAAYDAITEQDHNPINTGIYDIKQKKKYDIVSVPPYINEEIIKQCFLIYDKKMALLLPVSCLTDSTSYQIVFKTHSPIKIHVYSDMPYMWAVWERGNSEETKLDWIEPRKEPRQPKPMDENLEISVLDGIKIKIHQYQEYRLEDIVQFHSQAYAENQVMSNHYNCIISFKGIEFYGFEMIFAALRVVKHLEELKGIMAASSASAAKKVINDYEKRHPDIDFEEEHISEQQLRIYSMCQLFKYLSVKEYRDRLRELRGKILVECPNGHRDFAEANQNLDTNIFRGRNFSGRNTMLVRDMMLPLEDEAIRNKEKKLGRKLTDDEQEDVILEVCEQVRTKFENLPQVIADTEAVVNYIKDPRNGIPLKRKKLKPYEKPIIDKLSKAIIVDFDGCLFDTSVDDAIRKNAKGSRNWDAIYSLIPQYKLYKGWVELLTWARDNNIKIGVLCDAQRELVEKTMRHFKLPYDAVVGFQPYLDYPNPIRGNQMLNKLFVREKQVLYVGTTKDSEKQARCSQFKFVGGSWGTNEVSGLNVPIIDNPREAIKMVENLSF